ASHDGIGIRPVEGILTPSETQALLARASAHGGNISYKTNSDGSKSAYELNISYFDAISDPNGDEGLELQTKRFLASQAIILSLAGVPGIYVHSLFGSRNYYEGVEKSGRFRSINRKKFQRGEFENALANPDTTTAQVFDGYTHLLKIRRQHPAFHPQGPQQIIPLDKRVFAILRTSPDNNEQILCLINVSNQHLHLRLDSCPDALPPTSRWCDLLSVPNCFQASDSPPLKIAPYQILWLQKQ
ncbi:MAG: sugar phosphorylase, partial [Chloroflexota bacterium]|nr:sugar phosphorylase [Chloroflexota bacterium]